MDEPNTDLPGVLARSGHGPLDGNGVSRYTVRCLRPLSRRAFRTRRPPRVRMRARKPCRR